MNEPAMSENPYDAPKQGSEGRETIPQARGGRCLECGSANTGRDELSRRKPSVLYFILFGWLSLLIHGAFAMRTDRCRDCGAVHRYKTAGSWLALAVLILLVVSGVMMLMS
jgi:hypothetical protein